MKNKYTFLTLSCIYIIIVGILAPSTSAQTPVQKRFADKQVIVKFKPGMSPQELQIMVNSRNQMRSSLWKSFQLMLSDLKYSGKENEKPEARLTRIQNADSESGAVKKKSLYSESSPGSRNTFLYELSGEASVEDAVKIYSKLPEVEKAAPNYILRVMGEQSDAGTRYAQNQVMIKFSDGSSPKDIEQAIKTRQERSLTTLGKIKNSQEDTANFLRGTLSPERKLATLMATHNEAGVTAAKEIHYSNDVYLYKLDGTLSVPETIELFKSSGITAEVAPNYILYTHKAPSDPNYPKLWGIKNMNTEAAWDISTGSTGIKAAVVDTGVDKNHPDLKDNVKIAKQINASGLSDCPTDGSPSAAHGTHVSGTIGAVGNNSSGLSGVNWTVSILGYCVGSEEQIHDADVAEGINQAVADGANVINLSLGGPDDPIGLRDAINNAVSKNVTVVASAGNCKNNSNRTQCPYGDDSSKYYPASYGNVITVAAIGPNNTQAWYSNSGSNIDLTAPGGSQSSGCSSDTQCILSTTPQGRFGLAQGTSMSAPHVSGAVALLLSVNSTLTPQQVQDILQQSADDLGASGKDPIYGFGRVNIKKAIDLVNGTTPPASTPLPTQAAPSPSPVNTGTATAAPTQQPSPTSDVNHPCPDKVKTGNYNCDNATDNQDKEDFMNDFKTNKTPLAPFIEWIRTALYN